MLGLPLAWLASIDTDYCTVDMILYYGTVDMILVLFGTVDMILTIVQWTWYWLWYSGHDTSYCTVDMILTMVQWTWYWLWLQWTWYFAIVQWTWYWLHGTRGHDTALWESGHDTGYLSGHDTDYMKVDMILAMSTSGHDTGYMKVDMILAIWKWTWYCAMVQYDTD